MSVSLKKATQKTNIKHNNRTEKIPSDNYDQSRSHENKYLVQKDLKEIYREEFGGALEKYNAKQKRKDRKIKNYYDHVKASKKIALQQEMVIQVGDRDDFKTKENWEMANELLLEWFEGFEERNPNLKVYNAVIHNDEASPHLHINFVPVASEYKQGLEKQVAFNRAIIQQNKEQWVEYQALQERIKEFRNSPEQKNKKKKDPYPYEDWEKDLDDPFASWRENEVSELEKLMNERGIERKLVGTNEYKDVDDYKEKKRLEQEIKQLEQDLSYKKNELLAFNKQVPNEVKFSAKREFEQIEVKSDEKNFLGIPKKEIKKTPTGNVIVPEDDFKKILSAVRDNKRLKNSMSNLLSTDLAKENKKLKAENELIFQEWKNESDENKRLRAKNHELKNDNNALKRHISILRHEIGEVYESVKEFIEERTSDFETFKSMFKSLVDKVKGRVQKGEFEHLHDIENTIGMEQVKKIDKGINKNSKARGRDYDMEL